MLLLSSLTCLMALVVPAQAAEPAPKTTSTGLLKDVDVLERTYKALHPGLYRYNTPEQIDEAFGVLRREFAEVVCPLS